LNGIFLKKLKESLFSVLPITAIVVLINFLTTPMETFSLVSFICGSVFIILGMCLYTLGVDTAMTPIGSHIGSNITKTRKVWYILLMGFILGFIITIAEPDLTVLESQAGIKNLTYIIALGIGLFMLIAILRIVLKIKLKYLLLVLYGALFIIVIFASKEIIPLAFDSGGVTTGPITVPFIIALSSGITGVLGGAGQEDSEFGTIGICSVGPILMVLVIGIISGITPTSENYAQTVYGSVGEILSMYFTHIPEHLLSVLKSLALIILFFIVFQIFALKLNLKTLIKISFGIIYSVLGLALFFTGVNVGFMPTGAYIGGALANLNQWLIIPIGMVVGLFIVFAEPAVHVLAKQVENVTDGVIKERTMLFTLAISMALAVGLAMLRVVTKVNILWIIIPGYALAILLTFFVPEIFTGIAFDSGGVASGPMTATFLLPFAAGAATAISGESGIAETFGVVALVAMTPLLAVQVSGLIYKLKTNRKHRLASGYFADLLAHEGEIIDLSLFTDRQTTRKIIKEGLDDKIKDLKVEIDSLKTELNLKREELSRYLKRKSRLEKEE